MKKTAAQLAVFALEQLGIRHTFGIPGVHNTELYDALADCASIEPFLVTHELGASFMADAYSRVHWRGPHAVTNGKPDAIGTLLIVPAAGLTHAASGIGEAYLGGVPMLIITGGVRTDTPYPYKLHGVDQMEVAKGFTKAAFRITQHDEVISTIYEAHRIATSGCPGPVLVEIPVNLQLFAGTVKSMPTWQAPSAPRTPAPEAIAHAADVLLAAKQPGIFVGWGARHAQAELAAIAEWLQAPVSTTLQGLSSFPSDHALHAGFGFGPSATPAARQAFANCDALLAVGTRFAEIPTGSFGTRIPKTLVHIDIDPQVLNAQYPAKVAIEGDAKTVLAALWQELQKRPQPNSQSPAASIAQHKQQYTQEWLAHPDTGRVNPAHFFACLRQHMPADSITVLDDGNHTFLAAELYPQHTGGTLITPSDFNAMGYAVPAGIGAKMAAPERPVAVIVGDGCFTMTCMEMLTASANGLGVVVYVFADGSLSQIAQAQQLPYQRLTCTTMPQPVQIQGVAHATGAQFIAIKNNSDCQQAIQEANEVAQHGQPAIVQVDIDYSKATCFTKGTTKTNFRGFPLSAKIRFGSRIMQRKWFK